MMFKPHTDVGIFHVKRRFRGHQLHLHGVRPDGMGMELIDFFFSPTTWGNIGTYTIYIYSYMYIINNMTQTHNIVSYSKNVKKNPRWFIVQKWGILSERD